MDERPSRGAPEWESPTEDLDVDVLVVGGGAAGATAALAALEDGLTVAVVRRSLGATALTSGAFELAPDPLAAPHLPLGEGRPVESCVRDLAARRPDHPYGLLAGRLGALTEALELWRRHVDGVEFVPGDAANLSVATTLGTIKAAGGGLASVARGNLNRATRPVGVVGFSHHVAYDAELWARSLEDAAARAGLGVEFVPVPCELLDADAGPNLRPWEVAARVAADPAALAREVRRVAPGRVRQFLFPPVLEDGVVEQLRAALGVPCAEAAAVGQSVPGLRLQRALDTALHLAGARLVLGEVVRGGAPGNGGAARAPAPGDTSGLRVTPPGVSFSGRPWTERPSYRVTASAVVLAAGKYVAGGLAKNGCLYEPLFGLPVHLPAPGAPCGGSLPTTTAGWKREQPLFRAGVRADDALRPVDGSGRPWNPALFVCGDILAGHDPARDGAAMGTALLTGQVAGLQAAAHVRERGWGAS